MPLTKCRYRARAWCGEVLVADSNATLRCDKPDRAPTLWFPSGDVERDLLGAVGVDAVSGTGDLAGYVGLDGEQLRITLVDGADVDDPRSSKRFPNWGDAADLIDMMDVRPDGPGKFVSMARADWRRPVVEGSQMLGQTIVAAMRSTGGRRVVSASMVFVRGADSREPLVFALDVLTSGRTFSTVTARVEQHDRLCAVGTLLLDVTAPEVIHHMVPMPDVPGPDACPSFDMGVTGRDLPRGR